MRLILRLSLFSLFLVSKTLITLWKIILLYIFGIWYSGKCLLCCWENNDNLKINRINIQAKELARNGIDNYFPTNNVCDERDFEKKSEIKK